MDKLSIVIPTMQRNKKILDMLISQLSQDDCVGEIIIIDNSLQGYTFDSEKVFVHVPKQNMYVNPSWNFGVDRAKFNYIGILNDDLLLSKNICEQILNFIKTSDEIGVVGIKSSSVIDNALNNFSNYPDSTTDLEFYPINNIRAGKNSYWGSAIFGKKDHFHKIPEDILVCCGDDYYLFTNAKNNKTNYAFSNTEIKHCHSLTSSSPEFIKIGNNDKKLYAKIDPEFKKHLYYKNFSNLIQQVFSIQNTKNRSHKIITILGLKIKYKKKQKSE